MFSAFVAAALIALEVIAVWFAWRAVMDARSAQGALGWVVFLLAAPYLAVPLFLFLGQYKFRHYVIARYESAEVISNIEDYGKRHAPSAPIDFPSTPLEKISEMPIVGGNDMRLLIDGEATFAALFAAIDAANDYVLVQFYIVRDDATGQALADRMIAAAKRGVTVRFCCDPVGSTNLKTAFYQRLQDAGIQVIFPSQMRGPKNRFQINFRNHRKTVIVDGVVGFTGGLNVGEEYMGRDPAFGPWRDTHVELRGPIVSQLQLIFAEDWHWATDEILIDDLNWESGTAEADKPAMIVATGPGDKMESGALFFFSAIAGAKKRVWIASPYFVPDRDVLTALKHAALRGLDVKLLVPDVVDHRIPWLAAYAFFDEIREAGVEVWRYTEGFMHQKVVLVDDNLAAVGTTNLDNRSFRLNFETMAVVFDEGAAEAVAEMLERDLERAFLLDKNLADQPKKIRYGGPIARLFAPVL